MNGVTEGGAACYWSRVDGLSSLWVDGALEQVFTDERPERIVEGVLSLPFGPTPITQSER